MGIEIRNFPSDPSLVKNDINAILISSEANESAIYNQIRHLESYGITVYRLYDDLESL